jgi:hypothetical protein
VLHHCPSHSCGWNTPVSDHKHNGVPPLKVRGVLVSRRRHCGRCLAAGRRMCMLIDDTREKTLSERRTVNKLEAVSSCLLYHMDPSMADAYRQL